MMGVHFFVFAFAVSIPSGLFSPKPMDRLTVNLNVNESPKGPLCPKLVVPNANYAGLNGEYHHIVDMKVNSRPVYKLVNGNRYIFWNNGYGWCMGDKTDLKSGRHFFAGALDTKEPWQQIWERGIKVECREEHVTDANDYRIAFNESLFKRKPGEEHDVTDANDYGLLDMPQPFTLQLTNLLGRDMLSAYKTTDMLEYVLVPKLPPRGVWNSPNTFNGSIKEIIAWDEGKFSGYVCFLDKRHNLQNEDAKHRKWKFVPKKHPTEFGVKCDIEKDTSD